MIATFGLPFPPAVVEDNFRKSPSLSRIPLVGFVASLEFIISVNFSSVLKYNTLVLG